MLKSSKKIVLEKLEKTTPTFLHLMSKYQNHRRNISCNDQKFIIRALEEKRKEVEDKENDNGYIYKEVKAQAELNKELLYSYGTKAKSRLYDLSKFQTRVKFDRKKFFDPTKDSESLKKLKLKGVVQLPLISTDYDYINKPILIYDKTNINKKINTGYIFSYNNEIKDENARNKKSSYSLSFRNSRSNINYFNEGGRNRTEKNRLKKKFESNNNIFSYNGNYIKSLVNFKNELVKEEKNKRNYFNKNDYGCNNFKEKYKYIVKKYFETN